ncbi:hypothetical protein Tco_1505345 [Tanacetum coccineum]
MVDFVCFAIRELHSSAYAPNRNSLQRARTFPTTLHSPSTNQSCMNFAGTMLVMVIIVHRKFRLSLIRNHATIKLLMSSHKLCQVFIRHAILEMEIHSPYDSTPNFVDDSPNVFNPPPHPRQSDDVIKSSVEDLVPIPSESEGIFDNMCDVPCCDKNHFDAESDLMESLLNQDTSISYSSKINSLLEEFAGELAPINPIPSGIHLKKDIRLIEQLLYDDTSSDDDSYEDIDYVDASPLDSELVSLKEVKDFHTKNGEIEDDILRGDFYHGEFTDELAHIISPSEYDCFYFKSEPDPGELTSIVDSEICENVLSTTNVNLPFEDDQSPLFTYVVWIFLPFLTYPDTPLYLLSSGNEDTIFDPGISIYHSFMPSVSHRSGTFMKFNVYPNHLNESPMEILSSTCSPMDQ